MADQRNGGIAWCDESWNPVRGCSRVSEGCRHCYAESVAARFSGPGQPYEGLALRKASGPAWTGDVLFVPEHIGDPLRWTRPRRVFVNSMSDLFHEKVTNQQITAIFGVMAACPQHTFQVLTKRPERMVEWFEWIELRGGLGPYLRGIRVGGDRAIPDLFNGAMRTEMMRGKTVRSSDDPWSSVFNAAACIGTGPLPNVWIGVSAENQETANERIPLLLQTPAAVRFVSAEPLLGPIDFTHMDAERTGHTDFYQVNALTGRHTDMGRPCRNVAKLDWVIVGGESGPGARPCDLAWVSSIVDQCKEAGTAVFVKQLGAKPVRDVEPTGNFRTHNGVRQYEMTGERVELRDRKGGDTSEWPECLRVREFPVGAQGGAL